MNPGSIWWGQIGNSLRLLTKVTNNLRDCHSAVLQVPQSFPWRQDFYEAIDVRRSSFNGERRLVRLQWEDAIDPGEFVLNELCSNSVRAEYWPGLSYAVYLASLDGIVLNDYYVWITGIHSRTDIMKWIEFVAQYTHCSEHIEQRAVFILEYDGAEIEVSSVEKIVYSVENHDCRVFCLETAATLGNTDIRIYQAELALCIGGNSPELCSKLLEAGNELLQDPENAARDVIAYTFTSEGLPHQMLAEKQINSAAWKASVVLLFPTLERYRLEFIAAHEADLARHLPISNSNGDRISDPYDLEIGSIHYIVSMAAKSFSPSESENIRLCHKARNLMAHNKLLPYDDIRKLIAL